MVLQPGTVQYDKYNAVSYSITEYNIIQYIIINKWQHNVVQYNS